VAAEVAGRFPQDAFLNVAVARVYWHLGQEQPALEWTRRALALNPGLFEASEALAGIYTRFGHWAEAIPIYEALLRRHGLADRQRLTLLHDYAHALLVTGNPRAEAFFEQALAEARRLEDHPRVVQIYRLWGRRDDALRAYRERPALIANAGQQRHWIEQQLATHRSART
jgi:tetratricopeptide (TPR) repeat protein